MNHDGYKMGEVLDMRGWSCPWGLVKARSWLKRMQPGNVLEVLISDSEMRRHFYAVLSRGDDRILEEERYNEYSRLFIRKG